jgi:hypothetical protein
MSIRNHRIVVKKEKNEIDIRNELYPTTVSYCNPDEFPDIGVDYTYLQLGEEPHNHNYYMDSDGTCTPLNARQRQVLINYCLLHVQPLGQEGNLSISQLRIMCRNRIIKTFEFEVGRLTKFASASEIASYPKQIAEAKAYLSDRSSEIPLLMSLHPSRGNNDSLEELCEKILINAEIYYITYGELLGRYQVLRRSIEAATSAEELSELSF